MMKTNKSQLMLLVMLLVSSGLALGKTRPLNYAFEYVQTEHPETSNIPMDRWGYSVNKVHGSVYVQISGEYENYYFLWMGNYKSKTVEEYDYVFFEEEP